MTLYTLAHLFVALKLNDLVCMVKLMICLTWMTQLTDTALLVGKDCKFGHYGAFWSIASLAKLLCCSCCVLGMSR